MTTGGTLRIDHGIIEGDLKHTTTAPVHPHPGLGIPGCQLGRQTGGPWFVVSNHAIRDVDSHLGSRKTCLASGTMYTEQPPGEQRRPGTAMLPDMMTPRHQARLLLIGFTLWATAASAQLPAKIPARQATRPKVQQAVRPPAHTDSNATPWSHHELPIMAGAIFPASRVVAFYGNPRSTRMGILGELPPEQMLAKLDGIAREWARADTTRGVRPALHLIVTVAQARPGSDGKYRLRHPDTLIGEVARWAETRGWLLFLDIQVGQSSVAAELPRLVPWLKQPWVHLAIDPEFSMQSGRVPGTRIGTLDAREINEAIDLLAKLVDQEHLPPKVLVVLRFTENMLTNYRAIRTDPRVQVVIDMDGFGTPGLKKRIYEFVVTHRPVQFTGIKLFFKNDHPMMTMREILRLAPIPLYIQYQ